MRKYIVLFFALVSVMALQAQKITFVSDEFRDGVKLHLGLTGDDDVLQEQTDTITVIDLSGLHISDIRDVVFLPKVTVLNLADNLVADLSPLTVLDSLCFLNLQNNGLYDIDALAFSVSRSMTVDVSLNYITDFSYIMALTSCQFTLIGTQEQRQENLPYYKVNMFFASISDEGHLQVSYQGLTNIATPVLLEGIPYSDVVTLDGDLHAISGLEFPAKTTMLRITNGEYSDTTYVVPSLVCRVEKGTPIDIATGLPDDYRIGLAAAKHGNTQINGTVVEYTATGDLVPDTIYISYYKDTDLKGYTQIYTGLQVGDVNGDGKVNALDIQEVINAAVLESKEAKYDINGDGKVNALDIQDVINAATSVAAARGFKP